MDQHVKLESLEKRIQTLLSENDAAIKATESRLAEAETKLKEAGERRAGAIRRGDRKAFADAETEQREVNFDVAFLNGRLATLRKDPMITETDYKAQLSGVYDESLRYLDGVNAKIAEILLQLEGLRDEAQEICNRTDKAVKRLQRKVMQVKAPAGAVDPDLYFYVAGNGEQFAPTHAPRAGHLDPVSFISNILQTPAAQELMQQAKAAKVKAAKAEAAKRDGGTAADEDRD